MESIILKSVDELREHNGDLIRVNAYTSIWNLVFQKKLTGRLEIVESAKNQEYYDKQKDLIWSLNTQGNGVYIFRTIKEGYCLDNILDENAQGPIERKKLKKRYQQEIAPLEKITILECYHK